jgi:predicted dehydrogenase/threonine dehydrogenase-like Zn-dependent dehydrogenase
MKQVLRKGLKEIVVGEVPDPVAAPHHVLVRPFYSLISSGTETADIHTQSLAAEVAENPSHLRKVWEVMKQQGPVRTLSEVRAKFKEYAALGYSGAGVVVARHPTVNDLEVGDRVAYGGEGTGHGETILAGRHLVVPVPDEVPFEHACFTTLGSIALHSVRVAQLELGDTVVVLGLGLVGQLVAQLARLHGAHVIAVDLNARRVELARSLGADHALAGGASTVQEVNALTGGRGADCVIVAAASKSPAPAQQAVKLCRDRGRVVVVGAVPLDLARDEMYAKELKLSLSRAYGPGSYDASYEKGGQDYPLPYVRWTENRNMAEFLRQVALGRVRLAELITHTFPLEEAATAYQTIMTPEAASLAVLLRYPDPLPAGDDGFAPKRRVETPGFTAKAGGLGVALVGAGNFSRWVHLPNLKRVAGARLQAVHSSSGARGKSYAERFGARYAASDYEEVLNDPEVDVVLIASRHEHHFRQALAALRAGKHVFVEKPMAVTEDECRQLYHATLESGRQLTVGFNRRFAPLYAEQKKTLGRRVGPAVVNCRMNSPGLVGSFWAADMAYGGAIVGEGCHFTDLLYWLLGSEMVGVSAHCLPVGEKEPIGENNMAASFKFADGSVANLTYCTVGSKTSGGERVEAYAGGVGVAVEDFKRLTLQTGARHTRKLWRPEKGHAAQLERFLAGVQQGTPPEVTARDGARATLACLKMIESARTGAPAGIDLDALLG